jgi:predicted RNA-binding Zn ribbon-like protein
VVTSAGQANRGSDIGQAPGELGKLQNFVNTRDIEQGTDQLATPAALDAWLQRAGLIDRPAGRSGPAELKQALELREALRDVLSAHVAHKPTAVATVPAARLAATAVPLRARLTVDDNGRVALTAAGTGSRAALTRLLLIAAEAGTAGTWPRLKVCSADDCRWVFYDRSPARTGCWCSMSVCGSRAKSRAYRDRAARTG